MWKEYKSKPITRLAHEVKETDKIEELDQNASVIVIDGERVLFNHYEPVVDGDFIVRLTEEDTYHCSREVFLDRNIVD